MVPERELLRTPAPRPQRPTGAWCSGGGGAGGAGGAEAPRRNFELALLRTTTIGEVQATRLAPGHPAPRTSWLEPGRGCGVLAGKPRRLARGRPGRLPGTWTRVPGAWTLRRCHAGTRSADQGSPAARRRGGCGTGLLGVRVGEQGTPTSPARQPGRGPRAQAPREPPAHSGAGRGGGGPGGAQAYARPSGGESRGPAPGKSESPKLPQAFSPRGDLGGGGGVLLRAVTALP